MKVKPEQGSKGYTVSSIVVRNNGARSSVLEKMGLIAALAVALITGLWLVFVVL